MSAFTQYVCHITIHSVYLFDNFSVICCLSRVLASAYSRDYNELYEVHTTRTVGPSKQ
jgi:hypothetical protein